MFQQQRSSTFTWEDHAHWIKDHMSELRFTLNLHHITICTVWMGHDPNGAQVRRMEDILWTFFGAYLCGPMSNHALPSRPTHQSFGFWNQALLHNAKRVFPLPDGLQPGPIIYINNDLSAEQWKRVERAYNKHPKDLPKRAPLYE